MSEGEAQLVVDLFRRPGIPYSTIKRKSLIVIVVTSRAGFP